MNFRQAGTQKNHIGGIHALFDNCITFLNFKTRWFSDNCSKLQSLSVAAAFELNGQFLQLFCINTGEFK